MIKVVAFDYGGVIKINERNLSSDICDYFKINKEDWKREYFLVNHLTNIKNISFSDLIILVVSKFDNSQETKKYILDLLESNKNKWHLNNEIIDIIKNLKKRKYKIALLSNNSTDLRQELKKNEILNLFDEVIISAEVGFQKPQPEIFDFLFKKLEVNSNEVLFIDDTPKSLENADKIGYTPVLFKNNESLKSELSILLGVNI
ncbi:MAG TPA: HAD-IA family hydrolase [Candidatus Paceibacterota bacterium]|nr:HAD-IA family hydrolase [Candidatus Paceibacterota bacterium]